jgi:uncharacterized protein (DUF2235 family)
MLIALLALQSRVKFVFTLLAFNYRRPTGANMSKTIVFLADGTWNGKSVDKDNDGVLETTNVRRMYSNLAGEPINDLQGDEREDEKTLLDAGSNTLQVAKYLHGVGDSGNPIIKILGGVVGAGIISRIVRGYTFISRNYEPGDKIFIAGFSRGAYTARALGGMIAKDGLLNYAKLDIRNKEDAYRYGCYVWASYRENYQATLVSKAVNRLWRSVISIGTELNATQMHRDVEIAGIGVWDTVGAMGLPAYKSENERLDLFRFADTSLSDKVHRGFHALAIDESRVDFSPTMWTPRVGIEQAWFAGAHGDVGGGYEETGLADIAFDWMIRHLTEEGVSFANPMPFQPVGDFRADMHDEWLKPQWRIKPRVNRPIATDADVHTSVRDRRGDAVPGAALH